MTPFKQRAAEQMGSRDTPEFFRAGGDVRCEECGRQYRKHPHAKEYLDWNGDPYLRKLCDGSLVKL